MRSAVRIGGDATFYRFDFIAGYVDQLTVSKPQTVEPFLGDVSSSATGMTWTVQLTNGDSPIHPLRAGNPVGFQLPEIGQDLASRAWGRSTRQPIPGTSPGLPVARSPRC